MEKASFIEGPLTEMARRVDPGIKEITYRIKGGMELATIIYTNGHYRDVNISLNSHAAIVRDVARYL